MKKIAQFLQLALLLYFLWFLVFFFSFDTLGSVFGMDPLTPVSLLKVFLTGFILFLAAWAAGKMHQNNMDSHNRKLQAEMNELKAKLYDYEHPKVAPPAKTVPPKQQDDTGGIIRPRQNFTD
jgi:hypothetical protein